MKKQFQLLALAFIFFGFSGYLHAQDMGLGIRGGLNLANQTFESSGLSVSPDSKVGLVVGILADLPVTDALSIQPELDFIQKGASLSTEFFGTQIESSQTINYLELPVMAKYKFGTETIGIGILAGPIFGFGISGKSKVTENGTTTESDLDWDNDNVKRTDLGLGVGGVVNFGNLFLDLRYVFGIADIEDTNDGKVKNKGFQVGLGFMIFNNN
ncbi:MAG: PorT family protein [Bacteroidetes bacterium]|nr:MAG: PorT family protein [Bacteroidota bacterium]